MESVATSGSPVNAAERPCKAHLEMSVYPTRERMHKSLTRHPQPICHNAPDFCPRVSTAAWSAIWPPGLLAVWDWHRAKILARNVPSSRPSARESGLYPPPGKGTDADVERLIRHRRKMMAIKLYREIHSVDLKQAKEAVDELAQRVTHRSS